MKDFNEFMNEARKQTVEIPTTSAKEYKDELESEGHNVIRADDEGLEVQTDSPDKLKRWLKQNGWDQEDVKSLFS